MKSLPQGRFVLPLAAAAALTLSQAYAATVLVDFNTTNDGLANKTPDTAGNYWNTVTGTGTTSPGPVALVDTANGTSGITLQVTFTVNGGTGDEGFAGAGAAAANPGPGSGLLNQSFAYTDGIYTSNNASSGISLTLTGLLANTRYDFSVYGGRDSNVASADITLLTGSALIGDTTVENRSLADFNITSDGSGAISFRYRDTSASTSDGSLLTAMSVTQIPEPSAALLGGLGLLALLRRRRA